jgi:hypothetical protein
MSFVSNFLGRLLQNLTSVKAFQYFMCARSIWLYNFIAVFACFPFENGSRLSGSALLMALNQREYICPIQIPIVSVHLLSITIVRAGLARNSECPCDTRPHRTDLTVFSNS